MKIAIVGSAGSSRHLAPYGDKEWTIWSCSAANMGALPRWDAWFELHSDRWLKRPEHLEWSTPYLLWLGRQEQPVYMQGPHPSVPKALTFPKDALVEKFGRRFFTSSIAWMQARALIEKPTDIGLWGCDMAEDTEYAFQRPACLHFLEIAEICGIKTHLPPESDLAYPGPLYAYDDIDPARIKMSVREEWMLGELARTQNQAGALRDKEIGLRGALEAHRWFARTFASNT